MRCPECGAAYIEPGDSCAARFDTLLALDHSRREPWGSRHGMAFAAYALQHPALHARSLNNAFAALVRIYVDREPRAEVFARLRSSRGALPAGWKVPTRPAGPVRAPSTTIADLGEFGAETYTTKLDDWCRAALAMWGVDAGATSSPPAV